MNNILERDIDGRCFGECRDRVVESEKARQADIDASGFKAVETKSASWAFSRDAAPGFLGGHV